MRNLHEMSKNMFMTMIAMICERMQVKLVEEYLNVFSNKKITCMYIKITYFLHLHDIFKGNCEM